MVKKARYNSRRDVVKYRGAPGKPAKSRSHTWSCEECRTENKGIKRRCRVCGWNRDTKEPGDWSYYIRGEWIAKEFSNEYASNIARSHKKEEVKVVRQGKVLRTKARAEVVAALARKEGFKVTHEKGRAAIELREEVGGAEKGFSGLLSSMERDGMIKRVGSLQELSGGEAIPNSKRCYEVRLLVENLPENYADLLPDISELIKTEVDEEFVVEPVVEVKVVEKEVDYHNLAVALLNQVGEILTRDDWHHNQELQAQEVRLQQAREKLAQTLEDNNRLRVKYEVASDEVKALKTEVGGLRARVSQLELTLERQGRQIEYEVNAKAKKEVDRLMRQAPTQKGE